MIANKIPLGWESCVFGDIAKIRNGYAFKSKDFKKGKELSTDIPLVRQSQLIGSKIDLSEAVYLAKEFAEENPSYLLKKGDILIGMSGSIGKLCYYEHNFISLQNQRTGKIEIFAENYLHSKYIGLYLSNIENELVKNAKGIAVQNISAKDIEALAFPLPPLNEQKRIVAKIEELFSELDNGIAALKTAREQLKVYRQAVLKHAFEGKLTAKWREENADKLESPEQLLARIQQEREARYQQQLEDWETNIKDGKKLSKPIKPTKIVQVKHEDLPILPIGWAWIEYSGICEKIRNGIAAKPSGEYGDKIFRISAVRSMEFNLNDIRYLQHPDGQYNDYFLSKGDLVFTRYNGTRDYVGVCAEYKGDGTHLYPDKLIQTRVAVTSIIPSYLEKAINSGGSRKFIEKRIRTTAGQSGISGSDVKQMPVPICCKGEQTIIVLHLDKLLSVIKAINEEIESALTKAKALRQSILKKAFSGQLVPQDPSDEPASKLLARIQAEKEFVNTQKTSKSNKRHSVSSH